MRFTRIRASRSLTISTLVVAFALAFSMIAGTLRQDDAAAQGVDWLSADSVSYLTSSGIPVMVPSWIPGPVNGSAPEIYSGSGSYSIYFYAGSSFLYISGVAGGGFPGGSEANLNVQLSVNASVQGWPAIQDIGVPEGTPTPIYDKVMWIADGVFYTVSGNGLDTDSLTLANSSVALYASSPAVPDPVQPQPEIPAPSEPDTVVEQPQGSDTPNTQQSQPEAGANSGSTATVPAAETTTSSQTTASDSGSSEDVTAQPTATSTSSDGTSGPWFTGGLNADPSDGTDGANPPFLGDDGTGGAP